MADKKTDLVINLQFEPGNQDPEQIHAKFSPTQSTTSVLIGYST
jgi:hypothetical protein